MHHLAALLITLNLASDVLVSSEDDPTGWEPVADENGIKIIAKMFPGGLLGVRGDCVLDQPISRVAWIMTDDPRAHEWVDDLAEERVVRHLNNHEYIEYNHISMPMFITDRDFVTDVNMTVDPVAKTFIMRSHSLEDAQVPVNGDYLRGNIAFSIIRLTSIDGGKRTQVMMEMHTDPRGSLPHWLVNYFQKHWPEGAITGMRKQLAKPDLKEPAEWHELLEPLGSWQ